MTSMQEDVASAGAMLPVTPVNGPVMEKHSLTPESIDNEFNALRFKMEDGDEEEKPPVVEYPDEEVEESVDDSYFEHLYDSEPYMEDGEEAKEIEESVEEEVEEDPMQAIFESAEFKENQEMIESLSKEAMLPNLMPTYEEGEDPLVSEDFFMEDGEEVMSEDLFTEDAKIDDDIKPIIKMLNDKGYKTVASCSGHPGARTENDRFRDGVKDKKLYSTARVVFAKIYSFPNIPSGWTKKVMEEDKRVGIYVKAPVFSIIKGLPEKQFKNWKARYMNALESWAKSLPKEGDTKKEKDAAVSIEESVINELIIDGTVGED